MEEKRKWDGNPDVSFQEDDDRTILSEQDLNDLDAVELDMADGEQDGSADREKAVKKKILIIAGAALFAAAVTVTVLFLTRGKDKNAR